MKSYDNYIGIDVSKDTLDIYQSHNSSYEIIANTENAIQTWLSTCVVPNSLCILEPTGVYSDVLVSLLAHARQAMSLVSPTRSHHFSQVQGIISKNDKQAAYTLSCMGQQLDLPLYTKHNDKMEQRRQLLMGIKALKKQKQALKNQLHALSHKPSPLKTVAQALQNSLTTVEEQLAILEQELYSMEDTEHEEQVKLISSVVGIGSKTAQLLLGATGGLHHFERASQLSKFLGLVPSSHYSGSSVKRRGKITKRGDTEIRASLFMCVGSAIRFNNGCKALWHRLLKKGKPRLQIVIAVMNKLVRQAFGTYHSKKEFDNNLYLKLQK